MSMKRIFLSSTHMLAGAILTQVTPVGTIVPGTTIATPGIVVDACPLGAFQSLCLLGTESISIITQHIIVAVFVVAILLTLAFLIFGGFKWITSQGEKEDVEKARSTIIAAVLGLAIVFLSFFIINFVLQFFVPGTTLSNLTFPTLL